MTTLARFVRLPARRRRLVLRAIVAVAGFRVALPLLPFRWVQALAARARRSSTGAQSSREDIAWSVISVGRRLRSTCLVDALALQALLLREGHDANLRIGVAKTAAGRLEAHAWLDSGGHVLVGGPESARFTELPLSGAQP
jgi:hypothetical protein